MATYFVPTFNKTVAPGALIHHCKTRMVGLQYANNKELSPLHNTDD